MEGYEEKLLASNLKRELLKQGLSGSELSRRSGVPQPIISRVLSGKTQRPQTETLHKLAKALGVSVAGLFLEDIQEPCPATTSKEFSLASVPLYPLISFTRAGSIEGAPTRTIPFPVPLEVDPLCLFFVKAEDDGAAPTVPYHSYALIRTLTTGDTPRAKQLVLAFGRTSEQPIIRQLGMSEDRKPILTATNPQFFGPPLEECERILGTVIGEFKLLTSPYL